MGDREFVLKVFDEVAALLPSFLAVPEDMGINQGNVAACAILPDGSVEGRMFGTDKIRLRDTAQTAWRKASQVWITGYPTGRYEELVYAGKVDWWKFGIMKPDFIGWDGGFPVDLGGGRTLALAFSGMRGEKDLEILRKALERVGEPRTAASPPR